MKDTKRNIISIGIKFGADMVKDIIEVLKKAGIAKYGSPEDYEENTVVKKSKGQKKDQDVKSK